MKKNQAYTLLRKKLVRMRNAFLGVDLSVLLLHAVAIAVILLLVHMLLSFLTRSPAVLHAAAVISAALLLMFLSVGAGMLIRRRPRLDWIASEAERSSPEIDGDLLRGALDLGNREDDTRFGYSPALIEALILDAFRRSEGIRERRVAGWKRLRSALPILPVTALLLAVLFFLVPARTTGIFRALTPPDPDRIAEAVGLGVVPGDCSIRAGGTVPVEARFTGYDGEDVRLFVREGEGEWKIFPMGERNLPVARLFEGEIPPLRADAEYHVRFDGGESPRYRVAVYYPPVITRTAYTLRHPSYTGLDDLCVEENHGNVQALTGSAALLRCEVNKPVREAWIAVEGGDSLALRTDGSNVTGTIPVEKRMTYAIHIVDMEGNRNEDPVRYEVVPVNDEKPFVRVIHPGEDINLDQEMIVPLHFAVLDDYGIASVHLVFRKNDGEERRVELYSSPHPVTEIERERIWDLSDISLLPRDIVVYYLEAWDNDDRNGPNRGVSRTWQVRMPSLAEIFAEVTGDEEDDLEELEDIYTESKSLEEKLNELSREIQKNEELTWDDRKKIEGALEKQKQIEESLREVAREIDRTTGKLEENSLITPETIEKMMELTELMNEVATEEIRNALRELQQSIENMDRNEVEKAVENLEMTQQDFLERLNQAIEMLKRLKDMQDMDALSEGFRQMAEKQKEIREKTEQAEGADTDELAAEEKALEDEYNRMKEEMEKLAEKAKENSSEMSDMLKKSLEEMNEKKTGSKMDQASRELSEQKQEESSCSMKEVEKDLNDLSFKLTEYLESMCSCSGSKNQAAFGESIQDLLYLSGNQEEILLGSEREKRPPVSARRRFAERELEVASGIDRVMEKVRKVGEDDPLAAARIMDMLRRGKSRAQKAAGNFEEGDMAMARTRSGETMQYLNSSVVELLRSMENKSSSCPNPNSQGDGLSQMRRMTDQQKQLNSATDQFPMPSMNPSNMSMGERAQMARMAAEQQAIRKGIEELQREVEEGDGILGRLDEIAEEMREVERSLGNADLSPEVRERQEKILSRMLNAQRSLRERGYRRERRSRTAPGFERSGPAETPLSPGRSIEEMRRDLIRLDGFVSPREYEELIRSYFRALEKE